MKQLFKILLIISLGSVTLFSEEAKDGSLSVLVFSNGKPLISNEIKIDGKKILRTDRDGAIQTRLRPGTHQVEIFGKDKAGVNLGYFKKQVRIEKGKDTQVIATLSKTGADSIDIDVPVKSTAQEEVAVVASTGTGKLHGRVLSSQGNKPISGARVFVRGTSVDTRTDANGRFSATVPSGKPLSISVVHSAYSAQTLGGIRVKANGTTTKTVKLTPASMELEEFVVLAPKVEGSITDIIQEEKQINAIANIIGSEEFSKKGDSSAASALKRVTGVTLIGGKSIFVRGLGERYSNVELNSLPLPSPDPTKRVVPLDIFPSSMIGSMKVQKSGTADIPASFGGGYIDMRSKNKDEEDYIKIGFGFKGNANTGEDIISYQGSDTDWLGYDDGYRNIPSDILTYSTVTVGEPINDFSRSDLGNGDSTAGEARFLQMTKDYANRSYGTFKESLPIGGSFSIEGLKNFEINDEQKISVFGNYTYGQEHKYKEEKFVKYRYDTQSKPSSLISDGYKRIATSKYTHGAMLNVDYNLLDILSIKYTKLFTHIGEKNTRETEGVFGSNFDYQYYTYLDWSARTLKADQITGTFDYELFNKKNTFSFGAEYATATLHQPNNFLYQDIRRGETEEEYERLYYSGSQNFLGKKIESEDDVSAFYLNNKIEYGFFSDEDYMQFGLSYSSKERKSEYQRFYLSRNRGHGIDDYTDLAGGDPDGLLDEYVRNATDYDDLPFLISSLFDSSDYFDAEVTEADMFVNMFAKPYDNVEVMLGVRYVALTQTLFEYREDRNDGKRIKKEEHDLEINDFFPSVGVKYTLDEENIFDFAFSKTFIIPDLREFSSGSYFHPYDVANVHGNPDLNNTIIYSLDFKYSHYFSSNEYMKAGVFYKYLDKPIEDTQLDSSSLPIYSYENADYAALYGVELDGRITLDFVSNEVAGVVEPYIGSLSHYYISGNFSFTNSDVTLRKEQEELLSSNHRQLQGLSKTVVNTTFGYDHEDRSITLSYNKMGERIRKVGVINEQGVRFGDTLEVPPHLLDFVWSEKFSNGLTGKLKIGNILDSETIWKQDGKEIRHFQTGQIVSFGASYKF